MGTLAVSVTVTVLAVVQGTAVVDWTQLVSIVWATLAAGTPLIEFLPPVADV